MNKYILGVGTVLAIIGLCAIVMWTVNYTPTPDFAPGSVLIPAEVVESVATSPYIGKHVKMRAEYAIQYPAGTEGVIVAIPGSDDWCGNQNGTSVRWIDFPSKGVSCQWMSELEIIP